MQKGGLAKTSNFSVDLRSTIQVALAPQWGRWGRIAEIATIKNWRGIAGEGVLQFRRLIDYVIADPAIRRTAMPDWSSFGASCRSALYHIG